MESVFTSVGGLDDVYAVTQVAEALFRHYGQVLDGTEARTSSSPRACNLSEGWVAAKAAFDAAGTVMDSLFSLRAPFDIADGLSVSRARTDASFGISSLRAVDQAARTSLDAMFRQASVRHDALASATQSLNYNNGISLGQVRALTGLEASSWESFSYSNRATTFSSTQSLRRGSSVNLSD